jgi:hypothetical protein
MSKDDAGPKRPPRDEDASYVTMPPELRPFARPIDAKVIKPGDDPILDAAKAGIQVLDGDPDADPFYYDVKKRREEAKRGAGIGNVAVHVPPTSVPSAGGAKAEGAPPAKVVIAEPEAAASPWSKDANVPEAVRSSALPSSLRPRDAGANAAPGDRSRTKVVLAAAFVLVAIVVLVRSLATRGTPENGSQSPPPAVSTTAVPPAGPATSEPIVAPPSTVPAPPAPSSGTRAVVAPPSVVSADRPRPPPRPSIKDEDPYDAAVKPVPSVTAAPPVTAIPTAPTAPPPGPPVKNPVEGDRVFGN